MAKLWQKGNIEISKVSQLVEAFTIGKDAELDTALAPYDILGSLAHTKMLASIGLLNKEELSQLEAELKNIYNETLQPNFKISDGIEDIHSEVEFRLTERLGELGKKIHSGRSRNDQVLVDLKLYSRDAIKKVVENTKGLFDTLMQLSEQHKDQLMPGYTHMQIAMVSSFGLWFSAYAESLVDDIHQLYAAFILTNKNPLGSGAGYGGSLPLNRSLTTELLGFESLNYNSVYAQMNRGKMEKTVAMAMASLASTLSKLSMDVCLYMNQNFGFISFPDVFTTGSSIMPHKKNPDVFELIRGKCNKIQGIQMQFSQILGNLPSGYHRDLQLIKEDYLLMFEEINACLEICNLAMQNIIIKENILDDDKYAYLYSVEAVNELVKKGVPFREAYINIGKEIEANNFKKPDSINHTHEGSLGNLQLDQIRIAINNALAKFDFKRYETSLEALLS